MMEDKRMNYLWECVTRALLGMPPVDQKGFAIPTPAEKDLHEGNPWLVPDEAIELPPLTEEEEAILAIELWDHPTLLRYRAKRLELLTRRNE